MKFIGIDPGKSGGIAMIYNGDAWAWKMPKQITEVHKILGDITYAARAFCLLEFVHAMPGQGVTSMFSFGENYGMLQGVLTADYIDFELVTPQKWQKEFELISPGLTKTEKKNKNKQAAIKLYPTHRGPKGKITHATADAILIAEYARRVYE